LEILPEWFERFKTTNNVNILAWSLASYNLTTLEEFLIKGCKIRILLPSVESEIFAERCKSVEC